MRHAKPMCRSNVIWRLIHDGKLPAAKVGSHWRIKQSDLDVLLAGEL
jgi:excisionase family DNA binding protein